MLKVLLRKQFAELKELYLGQGRKKNRRSKVGTVGFALLFVFLGICFFFMFFGIAAGLGTSLLDESLEGRFDWVYFALMGLMSVLLGTIGSAFSTYSSLFLAKDNEQLLALPIPARLLLIARMTAVFATAFLYTACAWLPTVLFYLITKRPSLASVLCSLLLLFFLSLSVCVLSCFLGWIIALISARIRHKSLFTVLFSLAFIVGYYAVYFRLQEILASILSNAEGIERGLRAWVYPIYWLGCGAAGNLLSALFFVLFSTALFALCLFLLAKSFTRILTLHRAANHVAYKEEPVKARNGSQALLTREFKRFLASPIYLLNAGLGIPILIALGIVALVMKDRLAEAVAMLSQNAPEILPMLPVFVLAGVCFVASMDADTASSISLEGHEIWVLQSLPIDTVQIFAAKEKMHLLLNAIPAVFAVLCAGYAFGFGFETTLLLALAALFSLYFSGAFGLFLNLRHPSLDWTSEAVPVKQSAPVAISLFGGWGIFAGLVALYFPFSSFIGTDAWVIAEMLIFMLLYRLLNRWIFTKGAEIFRYL